MLNMMMMTMTMMKMMMTIRMIMLELSQVYETCLPSVVGPSEGASVVPGLVK